VRSHTGETSDQTRLNMHGGSSEIGSLADADQQYREPALNDAIVLDRFGAAGVRRHVVQVVAGSPGR